MFIFTIYDIVYTIYYKSFKCTYLDKIGKQTLFLTII